MKSMSAILVFLLSLFASLGVIANGDFFEFVALGDTAYTEASYPEYGALIKTINQADPDFTIHVGDTLGYQLCTSDTYKNIQKQFGLYKHPVIYTPGDNEWMDCYDKEHYEKHGYVTDVQAEYKLGRLEAIRSHFFNSSNSLGRSPIKLIQQSDALEHKSVVENRYWFHKNVLFATVHVVGSSDGLSADATATAAESIARRRSNLAWIEHLSEVAKSQPTKAIVLVSHASLFETLSLDSRDDIGGAHIRGGRGGPYYKVAKAIADLAAGFGKPLLFIHGDYHEFIIDRPFIDLDADEGKPNYSNITRLQVFGAPELKAVKVKVEPNKPWVFSFSPLY